MHKLPLIALVFLMTVIQLPAKTCAAISRADAEEQVDALEPLLDAIQKVESGGCKDPANALGDNGRAIGWLQMWPAVHADAKRLAPWLPPYKTCAKDRRLARLVAVAYWAVYQAHDDRERALIWHYGPSGRNGHASNVTDRHGYWAKVFIKMRSMPKPD